MVFTTRFAGGKGGRILIQDHHITVINATTGEVLQDFTLDPTRNYQPTGAP